MAALQAIALTPSVLLQSTARRPSTPAGKSSSAAGVTPAIRIPARSRSRSIRPKTRARRGGASAMHPCYVAEAPCLPLVVAPSPTRRRGWLVSRTPGVATGAASCVCKSRRRKRERDHCEQQRSQTLGLGHGPTSHVELPPARLARRGRAGPIPGSISLAQTRVKRNKANAVERGCPVAQNARAVSVGGRAEGADDYCGRRPGCRESIETVR
jgi:hypothetical protein